METMESDLEEIEQVPEKSGGAVWYFVGAVSLMAIPIIVGIVLANTGGDPNESSGMTAAPADGSTTVVITGPDRPNLSLGGSVVETSSDFNDDFAGAMAIDGSLSTEWSSRGDGDDAFIVIDLGSEQAVTGFGFRTREMTDGTSITNTYTVTIDDAEVLGPFEAGIGLNVTDVTANGRVFRFDMEDTTGGNTGAVEIEIYG